MSGYLEAFAISLFLFSCGVSRAKFANDGLVSLKADDDIGDDFLSAWKPSKMNSVPNLDFDCSQLNASEKTFKLSENL